MSKIVIGQRVNLRLILLGFDSTEGLITGIRDYSSLGVDVKTIPETEREYSILLDNGQTFFIKAKYLSESAKSTHQ